MSDDTIATIALTKNTLTELIYVILSAQHGMEECDADRDARFVSDLFHSYLQHGVPTQIPANYCRVTLYSRTVQAVHAAEKLQVPMLAFISGPYTYEVHLSIKDACPQWMATVSGERSAIERLAPEPPIVDCSDITPDSRRLSEFKRNIGAPYFPDWIYVTIRRGLEKMACWEQQEKYHPVYHFA